MKTVLEEICKAAFDDFLSKAITDKAIEWKEVSHVEEPPDYFLYIGDRKYAVEVSTLMEKLDVGTHEIPQVGVWASAYKLVQRVESETKARGVLTGTYAVGFGLPVKDLKSVRPHIETSLLDYVRRTKGLSRAPRERVYQEGQYWCDVQQVHDLSNNIEVAGTYSPKWEGEAAIQICQLLEERMATKKSKLQSLVLPKILLLYDAYRYASLKQYEDCKPQLASLSPFHTVYVVRDTNSGFLLHPVESNWQAGADS